MDPLLVVALRVDPARRTRLTTTSTRTGCALLRTQAHLMALRTLLPRVPTVRCCPTWTTTQPCGVKGPVVVAFLFRLLVCMLSLL